MYPGNNGPDTFQFKVFDPYGSSNVATVDMTVTAVNDAPVADDQPGLTTPEDTALLVTMTGSDVDVGDTLSFAIDTAPTHGTLSGLDTATGEARCKPQPGCGPCTWL